MFNDTDDTSDVDDTNDANGNDDVDDVDDANDADDAAFIFLSQCFLLQRIRKNVSFCAFVSLPLGLCECLFILRLIIWISPYQ